METESIAKQIQKYYNIDMKDNPTKNALYCSRWRKLNPEKNKEIAREWRERHSHPCLDCGVLISPTSQRCKSCAAIKHNLLIKKPP
jgi:hypothetical protein